MGPLTIDLSMPLARGVAHLHFLVVFKMSRSSKFVELSKVDIYRFCEQQENVVCLQMFCYSSCLLLLVNADF